MSKFLYSTDEACDEVITTIDALCEQYEEACSIPAFVALFDIFHAILKHGIPFHHNGMRFLVDEYKRVIEDIESDEDDEMEPHQKKEFIEIVQSAGELLEQRLSN